MNVGKYMPEWMKKPIGATNKADAKANSGTPRHIRQPEEGRNTASDIAQPVPKEAEQNATPRAQKPYAETEDHDRRLKQLIDVLHIHMKKQETGHEAGRIYRECKARQTAANENKGTNGGNVS